MPAWMLAGAFVLVGGGVAAWMFAGNNSGPLPVVLLLGAYLVAAYRPMREVLATAAVMVHSPGC